MGRAILRNHTHSWHLCFLVDLGSPIMARGATWCQWCRILCNAVCSQWLSVLLVRARCIEIPVCKGCALTVRDNMLESELLEAVALVHAFLSGPTAGNV
jgi:hypothetical protein